MNRPIPKLSIAQHGSSGIEIRAELKEKFDLVEFTLRDDVPQPIFISPWMQFEPPAMNEWRHQIAHEIARRAVAHDELVKQADDMFKRLKMWEDSYYKKNDQFYKAFDMWREERVKYGLTADFSDIPVWPPEFSNDYERPTGSSTADKMKEVVDNALKAFADGDAEKAVLMLSTIESHTR